MSYSITTYAGDGSTTVFTVPFSYLDKSHVGVKVGGYPADFTWLTASSIRISPAPTNTVEIRRTTPKDTTPVNFSDGSVLAETDLDLLALFSLYNAQESQDTADLAVLQSFLGTALAKVYQGSLASAPSVRLDGNALLPGDMYFDTVAKTLKVFTGVLWQAAGVTVPGILSKPASPVVATGGQTVVTVTGGYDPSGIIVFLNGAALTSADVTTTSGVSIVFATPLTAGDEVTWLAFGAFLVGDTWRKADLAASEGASLVANGGETIAAIFKSSVGRVVDSITALAALDKTRYTRAFVTGYLAAGDGGGGPYYLDAADSTSLDNGGTIIVGTGGGRWKLSDKGAIRPEQFGAFTTSTDTTAKFTAMLATGRALVGEGGVYKVSTLNLPSNTNIRKINFESTGWVGDPTLFQHHQPVIHIDGTTVPKRNFYFEDVAVNGRRDLMDNITFFYGEDGGMHAWRIVGDVQNIYGIRCKGFNAGTAGICTHYPTPSATVNEYKIQNVKFIDSEFTGNREHGWFGDSIKGIQFIRTKFTGNGLDLDATKPIQHGLRGATVNVGGTDKYFGCPWDIESYAVGSGVADILIEDADCRGNACGALMYDPTPSNSAGFVPRSNIRIRGGQYDTGLAVVALDPDGRFPLKIRGNFAGGAKPFSNVSIEGAYLDGSPYFNGVSKLQVSGGFINAITQGAYVYSSDYWSITSPGLSTRAEQGGQPIPGLITFTKASGAAGAALTVTQELIRTHADGSYEISIRGSLTGGLAANGPLVYSLATTSGYLLKNVQASARRADTGKPMPADGEVQVGTGQVVFDTSGDTNLFVNMNVIVHPRLG